MGDEGIEGGWVLYPPLSAERGELFWLQEWVLTLASLGGINWWIAGLGIVAAVVAFFERRYFVGSVIGFIAVNGIIGAAGAFFQHEGNFEASFFSGSGGGDPILFQHFFWFLWCLPSSISSSGK